MEITGNKDSTKKEVLKICQKCDLGDIISLDTVNEGVLNENHIINTDKGKFFLKYCKDKTPEQMEYIWLVEKFMSESLIPAIVAIDIDSEKGWMLYQFIESDRTHSYNLKDYYLMGQVLGNVHKISYNSHVPEKLKKNKYKENSERSTAIERMKNHVERIKQKKSLEETDSLFLSYIDKKLACANKINKLNSDMNDTLVHGDFHAGNLLIDKKSRDIIGICDWEKTQYAPRSYDLARSYLYVGFGTLTYDIKECLEISEEFLKGYRSVIDISDKEFKQGLLMRLRNSVLTTWIEDKYYLNDDSRANKFLKNSIMILDYFLVDN